MRDKQIAIVIIFSLILTVPLISLANNVLADDLSPRYIHLTWQNDPKTTQTVSWKTDISASSIVQYGIDDSYGSEANDVDGSWHHVEMTGLSPDTIYHYRVGDGSKWSRDYTFKTGTTGDLAKFLAFGDAQGEVDGRRQIVRAIERVAADFVLFSGDFVDTSTHSEEWYGWFSSFSGITSDTTLMPTMGNHEKNISFYYDAFALPGNEEFYSFDYGPLHIPVLHTYYEGYDSHGNYDNQAAWLINDLEANLDAKWTIVMMHRPPFSSYTRNYEASDWYKQINSTFVPIFENYNISFVIMGHEHGYERLLKNNINYLIAAGGGSRLYHVVPSQILNESQYQESTYNFVYFEVDENKIHARAYRPNYSFIDEVYINKQDKADLSFVTLPLTYTDDWNETSNLEMSVMVANTGEKNITSETQLELEIYETPSEHRDYVPMPIIDTFEIPPLDVGENYTLDFNWAAEVQTTFRYTLTLDNLEIVDEVTEENNEIVIYQTFYEPEKANFIAEGVLGFVLVLSFLLVPTLIRKRVKRK
ncbi:MAG: metallophosphoesterase [Candidatus Heimdallarchaeota archaeon]|nr:metallophosphoesterase [Candidatus Heimdallarchaeota archaeon]MCK4955229.1 metallophosphoesterase [Candidatus Heimdallarchaeota archaeon]